MYKTLRYENNSCLLLEFMDPLFLQKLAFKAAMVILIVGALNWLSVGLLRKNPVELVLGRGFSSRAVYVTVGVAALAIMFYRDTYLPFLGETVMPCSALAEQTPRGADTEVRIQTRPNAKVIYWASEPDKDHLAKLNDWRAAYLNFENVGVTTANGEGSATLRLRKPQPYTVPIRGRLDAHVHYRVCGEGAMLGRVETVFLTSAEGGVQIAESFVASNPDEDGAAAGRLFY